MFIIQALDIVQFVPHALKVAAVKTAYVHSRRISAPVFYLVNRFANIDILTGLYIIGRISIAEAVYKDLVHHGTFCPVRSVKTRCDLKIKLVRVLIRNSQTVILTDFCSLYYFKMIQDLFLSCCHCVLIIVKKSI